MARYALLFKDSVAESPAPRWVTLLDSLDESIAPELRIKVNYVPIARRKTISETITGRKDWTDSLGSEKFKLEFLKEALKSKEWEGMTKFNLKRFGEFFLERPSLVDSLENIDEFPSDDSDFEALFGKMRADLALTIINAAISMDEWANEELERLKNA